MPNPTVADLHVNVPLTNVSVAYMQSADSFIADKIFPRLPVDKQSNIFYKYSKSDWRRTDVERRAPSTESAGTGWNTTTDQYFAHVYAVHKDIDDQTRANADSVWNLDRDSTEFVTNQHLLKRDIDWTSSYFKSGVWATEKTGVATGPTANQFIQWDQASSDPIGDVSQWIIDFRQLTGFAPNVAILGPYVMKALKQHPDILDRIKYTQKGIVTEDLIATLFDVDELFVTYATKATGPQIPDAALQDAAASYSFIGDPKGVLFAYAPQSPSLLTPSAGYTFTWKGYMGGNSMGVKVSKFRMQHIKSDRIEAEQSYDMKVVCNDMGLWVGSAVA
jgi:hypothetical protein